MGQIRFKVAKQLRAQEFRQSLLQAFIHKYQGKWEDDGLLTDYLCFEVPGEDSRTADEALGHQTDDGFQIVVETYELPDIILRVSEAEIQEAAHSPQSEGTP